MTIALTKICYLCHHEAIEVNCDSFLTCIRKVSFCCMCNKIIELRMIEGFLFSLLFPRVEIELRFSLQVSKDGLLHVERKTE